jgi:hypothetical protein
VVSLKPRPIYLPERVPGRVYVPQSPSGRFRRGYGEVRIHGMVIQGE